MIIGWFATEADKPYAQKLTAMIGVNSLKVAWKPQEYKATVFAKMKALSLDAIICTCPETLVALLNTQPDFRHPIDKRGTKKRLSLDDYAGSCFTISKESSGAEKDVAVLCLNPLEHLVKVPSAPFVFKRFISKILTPDAWFPQTTFTWEYWKPERSDHLFDLLTSGILLSVDIETYRDEPLRRIQFVGYCVLHADGTTHSVVVPFKDMVAHDFVRRVNACGVAKLFQNGLYDNLYFARFGVPCNNWLHDTQHMFHSWFSELPKRLDFITAFCIREIRFWKDDNAGSDYDKMEYNARDCWSTMMTYLSILQNKDKWVIQNYLIEFPLVFPCLHVEMDGLQINMETFEKNKKAVEAKLDLVMRRLRLWFGDNFNPRSPVQVKNVLKCLTGKEQESSDEKTMNAVKSAHVFNELILGEIIKAREYAKLLSTYFVSDKFWNGRLHYKLNPAGTDTGRLASSESSYWCGLQIQNIPGGPDVKSYVEADDGYELAEADYAQSEARCVGYISGCTALINLVESDKDYHSWNAQSFFGIAYEEIWDGSAGMAKNKKIRDLSKRTNHGANYNMGAKVMLETMGPKMVAEARDMLKLPKNMALLDVCQYLLNTYAKTYPEVKKDMYDWVARTISMTKKTVSALGWTRYFFNDPLKSKPALNAAIAHVPQNLSVGIINEVFYAIWHRTVYGDLVGYVRLKAQIHDSILFCYRGGIEYAEKVRKAMENPKVITDVKGVKRTMLIPPDLSAGKKTWAELK